jgi:hypothetical protein
MRMRRLLRGGRAGACQAESQHREEGDNPSSERPFPPSTLAALLWQERSLYGGSLHDRLSLGCGVSRQGTCGYHLSNYPKAALEFRRVRCAFQRTKMTCWRWCVRKARRTLLPQIPSKPERHSEDRTTGDDVVPEQFAAAACFVVHPQHPVAKR